MVQWILEKNIISDTNYNRFLEIFRKHNIKYNLISVISDNIIEGSIPKIVSDHVIAYGSIGISKVCSDHNWVPGVFGCLDNFEYQNYIKYYSNHMLNSDAIICSFDEVLDKSNLDDFFIKPNKDNKEFAGTVISRDNFITWRDNMLKIGYLDNCNFEVIVSKPKNICKEYRVVVVNNHIVSASQYRDQYQVKVSPGISNDGIIFAQNMIKIYQPADVFVLDIGETPYGFKILECNMFNHADLYNCDIEKIVLSINEFVQSK